MGFTKEDTAEMLVTAVSGFDNIEVRGDEGPIQPYKRVRKALTGRGADPDVVWLRDGQVVAAFEIEGIDVEEGFDKGLHKDLLTTTSPDFSKGILRVVLLFQLDKHGVPKDRMRITTKLRKTWPEAVEWYLERARWLRTSPQYAIPENELAFHLDDELGAPGRPSQLLQSWAKTAAGKDADLP